MMIRLGSSNNSGIAPGKTFCGRAIHQVNDGYLVKFGDSQQHTGIAITSEPLAAGKELLFKVVGYRNGQALLHPVFAGYR